MAFRNAALPSTSFVLPNSLVTLYTCPNTAEAVVHGLYIANVSASQASVAVDVVVTINNPTLTSVHVLKATTILYGTSLVFDKPVNLRPSDTIQVSVSTASSIEVNASILLNPVDTTTGW